MTIDSRQADAQHLVGTGHAPEGDGVVVAPHFLASEAGARVLQREGNAVDAAIAANAVLTVVYPHMCGIGGDLFALTYDASTKTVRALNGSGPAPQAANLEAFKSYDAVPLRGVLPITVPGAVAAWDALLREQGTWSLSEVLADAISLAEGGFEISARAAAWISDNAELMREFPETARIMLSNAGTPPLAGDRLVLPELAATLTRLAEVGARDFYEGETARQIAEHVGARGGYLTEADLAAYQPIWCMPSVMSYGDLTVHTTPPNSQGIAYLLILRLFEAAGGRELTPGSSAWIRALVEAKRSAFHIRDVVVGDPALLEYTTENALDDATLEGLLAEHRRPVSTVRSAGALGDTIAIASMDANGNACSLIESIYFAFGSMKTVPDTGILLQNRGAYFTLDPLSNNCIGPGKRPLHTLMPGVATEQTTGSLRLVLGTMGGDGQPQTLAQITSRVSDHGVEIGEALDAPRFLDGRFLLGEDADVLTLESRFDPDTAEELRATYQVQLTGAYDERMGHACGVVIAPGGDGAFQASADRRGDGSAQTSTRPTT